MTNAANFVDTHVLFTTASCEHLDVLVYWATGNFPDSGLLLVQCADGQWFVEVEYGVAYENIEGLSRPFVLPYAHPTFFKSEAAARDRAMQCLLAVHPGLQGKDVSRYYSAD